MDMIETGAVEPAFGTEDLVSRILGFARFCMGHAAERPDDAAHSRGWLDSEGQPTEEGRALIEALTSRDSAYGVYRLPV
ncbi:MAG: hypothetical protein ACP5EN_07790 [Rhodovulum sp.]